MGRCIEGGEVGSCAEGGKWDMYILKEERWEDALKEESVKMC
jgi:hypothetical protein